MKDGDTIDNDAQQEIERLKAEKQELEAKLAKTQTQVDEKEGMINKQGNELGKYRTTIDELVDRIDNLEKGKKPDATKDEGGSAKTPEEIEREQAEMQKASTQAEVDRLTSLITEEDDAKLNEAYESATPDVQAMIDSDLATRKKFLEGYLGDRAVPKRSWRGTPSNDNENKGIDVDQKINELFGKVKSNNNLSPTGSSGGAGRPTGQNAPVKTEPKMSTSAMVLGINRQGGVDDRVSQGKPRPTL